MSDKKISFIIPHYGRENLLVMAIQSIVDQDYDLEQIEVILVTQNKELSETVHSFQNQVSLSVLTQEQSQTISQSRNAGVMHSSGAYLAFIDADVSISANWINCMLEELESSADHRTIVSAIQTNSANATSVEKIRTVLNNISSDKNVDALHGSNLFLTRETFELTGGFPPDLTTCEDVYFTSEAGKYGNLYMTSGATHIHLGEDRDYRGLFKKEIWRGQSNIQSIKGRRIPLRELPSIIIPLVFLLVALFSIVLLTLNFLVLSLASFILFLLPVILYSARLMKHSTDKSLNPMDYLLFYLVYFSARSIGTYFGLVKTQP